MSEQDKKSGGTGAIPVVVEQTTNSRHKAPYRPNDIQDETDHHHKHSKAPAVQSVAEEMKHKTAEDLESENEDDKEHKRVKSSEMNKQNAAKKLSSISKNQGSPADSIALGHELETKKGSMTPTSQPIPQVVEALSRANFGEKENNQTGDTDSIAEEISEGRIVKPSKKYSNWETSHKNKELTWQEKHEEGIIPEIDAKSQAWILERRASVGPCFRPGMPFEGPTGIAIHIPRKSMSTVRSSGININMSRKNLNSRSKINIKREKSKELTEGDEKDGIPQKNNCEVNFLSTLKEKLSSETKIITIKPQIESPASLTLNYTHCERTFKVLTVIYCKLI
ncbi:uncharacterized protein LOC110998048 [Pieris rapae]|uniref:uncharacterized protein LOC110998048 n=1 Tax=Pieris rapae TaxID=64459 RepID=UPI001E27B463|nr:uncharacterized protein LOC110998048 [Pieris rapae]